MLFQIHLLVVSIISLLMCFDYFDCACWKYHKNGSGITLCQTQMWFILIYCQCNRPHLHKNCNDWICSALHWAPHCCTERHTESEGHVKVGIVMNCCPSTKNFCFTSFGFNSYDCNTTFDLCQTKDTAKYHTFPFLSLLLHELWTVVVWSFSQQEIGNWVEHVGETKPFAVPWSKFSWSGCVSSSTCPMSSSYKWPLPPPPRKLSFFQFFSGRIIETSSFTTPLVRCEFFRQWPAFLHMGSIRLHTDFVPGSLLVRRLVGLIPNRSSG